MATTKSPSLPSLQLTHELNTLVDRLISLREKNEPLAPSIEAILYRTRKQKILLETFHSEGPRIVAPLPSKLITWGDMIDEGLSHLDFKPYGDGNYGCNVDGIILEVTKSERNEILSGNCEPYPPWIRSKSTSERRARFETSQYVESMIDEISRSLEKLKKFATLLEYDPDLVAVDFDLDGYTESDSDSNHDDINDELPNKNEDQGPPPGAITESSTKTATKKVNYSAKETKEGKAYVEALLDKNWPHEKIEEAYMKHFGVHRTMAGLKYKFKLRIRRKIVTEDDDLEGDDQAKQSLPEEEVSTELEE